MKFWIEPRTAAPRARREEIEAIAAVIERQALEITFQPIYHMRAGVAFGFEVLTSSPSPIFASAVELFDAASRSGQVGELGRLQRSLALKVAPSKPLFINIHPAEFDHPLLIRPDDPVFRHSEDVYLEITESAPLSYFEQCVNVLGELRKKGVRLAIDDFGAGFSNVKYISDLAPDIVKLDRELVAGIQDGSRQFRLLRSVVRLCRDMGAKVVAEGIETADELVVVERAGVEFCQGFLLGRPHGDPSAADWPGFR